MKDGTKTFYFGVKKVFLVTLIASTGFIQGALAIQSPDGLPDLFQILHGDQVQDPLFVEEMVEALMFRDDAMGAHPVQVAGVSLVALTIPAVIAYYAYHYYYSDDRHEPMSEELSEAIQSGDVSLVSEILDSSSMYGLDAYGRTPLCLAAGSGRLSIVKLLIERGVDVNERGIYRNGALFCALSTPEILAALLDAGADMYEAETSFGLRPLDIAEINNYRESADLLISRGAQELPWITRLNEALRDLILPNDNW